MTQRMAVLVAPLLKTYWIGLTAADFGTDIYGLPHQLITNLHPVYLLFKQIICCNFVIMLCDELFPLRYKKNKQTKKVPHEGPLSLCQSGS